MTSDGGAGARRRKQYERPVLRRVRLVPNEAVLASCKNSSTAGPVGPVVGKCAQPPICSHNAS